MRRTFTRSPPGQAARNKEPLPSKGQQACWNWRSASKLLTVEMEAPSPGMRILITISLQDRNSSWEMMIRRIPDVSRGCDPRGNRTYIARKV